jgi:hypothetical protein
MPTTRLVHLVVDSADPSALARFWSAALGWKIAAEEESEVDVDPEGFTYPEPRALPLVFVPVPEPKTTKNRVHLDLASDSPQDQAEQVSRLRELGAVSVDIGQGEVPWEVMADPQGNEFCVLEPRAMYRDTGPVAAVVVDSTDPPAAARFWREAAGFDLRDSGPDFASLRSPDGVGPYLEFVRVPEAKTVKNRVHLDLRPYGGEDQDKQVQRLREAGARPADVGQGDAPWVVLTDPEGSEFCVLGPL